MNRVRIIASGIGDGGIAAREQWNNGTNTLVISRTRLSPTTATARQMNYLKRLVLEVLEIDGSELVRGRASLHEHAHPPRQFSLKVASHVAVIPAFSTRDKLGVLGAIVISVTGLPPNMG